MVRPFGQLNKMESRKIRRSRFRAARVRGCSVCSKARWVAATYGATDERLARSIGYLGLDLIVLLLLRMLLLLILLLLLLLISLVAIANHLLELSHNIGRDLLEQQTPSVDIGLVAGAYSMFVCQSLSKTAASWMSVTWPTVIIHRRTDISKGCVLRLGQRESCFI
jgi:hypothetical protein